METILGVRGKGFVLLAADTMLSKSTVFIKDNQTKIRKLSMFSMLGAVGSEGDSNQFAGFIKNNVRLYEIENDYLMGANTLAHFTRNKVVENLQNKVQSQVAVLLASYDPSTGSDLTFIDSQGSSHSLNYSGHGMGNSICTGIFRTLWKPNLSCAEAYDLIKKCVFEIQKRGILNLRNFEVFVVDKDGVRELKSISNTDFKDSH